MNDGTTRFQRITALLGIPTAAVMVLAAALKGKAPSGGASYADVASFFTAHHTALLVDGVLSLLTMPLLLLVVAGLRSRSTASGAAHGAGSLLMGSAAVLVTVLAVQTGLFEATVQHVIGRADASTARLLSDVSWMLYAALGIATASLLIAFTAVAATTQSLPRWSAWMSGVLGVLALVASCASVYDDTSGVGVLGLVAWLGAAAWIAIVSVTLLGRSAEARATGGAVAAV